MANYYCLVTSLPLISIEDNKINFNVKDFKDEYWDELSAKDRKLLALFYYQYDNANLLTLLKNEEANIDSRGIFTSEELLNVIYQVKDDSKVTVKNFPTYLVDFLTEYFSENRNEHILPEDLISSYYLNFASKANSSFIANWFSFNKNLNNLLVALSYRKMNMDYTTSIIGDDEISEAIKSSGSRDFGLSSDLSYLEGIIKLSEIDNLFEREKKTDLFKWDYIEEHVFFHYFSVEKLFAFLLQLEMVERWMKLDNDRGVEMFRGMIDTLKNEINIPNEFRI